MGRSAAEAPTRPGPRPRCLGVPYPLRRVPNGRRYSAEPRAIWRADVARPAGLDGAPRGLPKIAAQGNPLELQRSIARDENLDRSSTGLLIAEASSAGVSGA